MKDYSRNRYFAKLGKRHDVKLHVVSGEELDAGISHTQTTLVRPESFPTTHDEVITTLYQLSVFPQWTQLNKKMTIPFFGKENPESPPGIIEIQHLCQDYFRGTLSHNELLQQLGEKSQKKMADWAFMRSSEAKALYTLLSNCHQDMTNHELKMLLPTLMQLKREFDSMNLSTSKKSIRP